MIGGTSLSEHGGRGVEECLSCISHSTSQHEHLMLEHSTHLVLRVRTRVCALPLFSSLINFPVGNSLACLGLSDNIEALGKHTHEVHHISYRSHRSLQSPLSLC
jgi:hypothetical protein